MKDDVKKDIETKVELDKNNKKEKINGPVKKILFIIGYFLGISIILVALISKNIILIPIGVLILPPIVSLFLEILYEPTDTENTVKENSIVERPKYNCDYCNRICYGTATVLSANKICANCLNRLIQINNSDIYAVYGTSCDIKEALNNQPYEALLKCLKTGTKLHGIKRPKIKFQEELQREENSDTFNKCLKELKYANLELSSEPTHRNNMLFDSKKIKKITRKIPDLCFNNFIVIDTETTGLNSETNEIIEMSAIKFENGDPIECLTTLIKPKKKIPSSATSINHITDEMVENSPEIEYAIESFNRFIEGYNIVAYNAEFDCQFWHNNGIYFSNEINIYDVLELVRIFYADYGLLNYKLDTLCDYLGVDRGKAHRATEDALIAGIIFNQVGTAYKNQM